MNGTKLRNGQAVAIQWVAFLLQKIDIDIKKGGSLTRALLTNVDDENMEAGLRSLVIGCNYVALIALALTIELALKGLLLKKNIKPKRVHDLVILYEQLTLEMQNALEERYRDLKKIKGSEEKHFKNFLVEHKNDFEGWRYLDKAEKLRAEEIEMQEVVWVILDQK